MKSILNPRIHRRDAIRWVLVAAGSVLLPGGTPLSLAAEGGALPTGTGYGTDPDLIRIYRPGDLWPLTFSDAQRRTAAALCDCIIPADEHSPSASAVGVSDFIDEWISAPYPAQQADRRLILDGFEWLDAESQRRFQTNFAETDPARQEHLCGDIAYVSAARPGFETAARFFKRYRDLTAGGFYTTAEGTKDIGYVGNVPLVTFDGPPADLIAQMGLD